MDPITITEINIYPIKSLGGVSLEEWDISDRGLKYDRRWMLVDENNQFISQRKYPQLSLLRVSLTGELMRISNKDYGFNEIRVDERTGRKLQVTVWESTCAAEEVSKRSNDFFSAFLSRKVTLVHMPEDTLRYVDPNYASSSDIVSFADGFPILLIGEASLRDLNSKLIQPVLMNRFRPNFVVGTSVPFDEDNWENFTAGNTNFKVAKPCARCIMTTIDQRVGKKGIEPLKTLSSYRSFNNKVMFGQNVLIEGGDRKIRLGDAVFVTSRKKV